MDEKGRFLERRRSCAPAAVLALALVALVAPGERVSVKAAPNPASGEVSVAHRAGGRRVPAARLARVTSHRVGQPAAEPTLGVTHKGDVFYAAAGVIGGGQLVPPIDVLRSTDGGRSWENVSPKFGDINRHFSTGDPYVYVDRTKAGDRVFTVDLQGYVCSLLSFTDDGGSTWVTNPLGCGRPVNDHQTVFAGPPVESATLGYPKIVYYCYQDVVSSSCSKSLDGGVTFVPAGGPSFESFEQGSGTFCGGLHGHGYADPNGTIYIPKGHCGLPWLAVSRDEGRTWTRTQVSELASADHEASVAADGKGNVYYGYIGADKLPYLVVSRDGGDTWRRPLMVGSPGLVESSLPSVDIGRSGIVAFAYMGTTDSGEAEGGYADVTWDGYVTATRTALSKNPLFHTVSVNDPADPLIRGECPQTKCGPVYDFVDVVIAPDDTVWSAFVDGCLMACVSVGAPNDGSEGIAAHIRVPR